MTPEQTNSGQVTDKLPVPESATGADPGGSSRFVTQELHVRRGPGVDGSARVTEKLRVPDSAGASDSDGADVSAQVTEDLKVPEPGGKDPQDPDEPQGGPEAEEPKPRKGRLWRELSGALAAGVVLLAVAVLVLQIISWNNGVHGLGVGELIGHVVAAGLAVYAQRVIDRRPGRPAVIAGVGMVVIVSAVLVLFWWI